MKGKHIGKLFNDVLKTEKEDAVYESNRIREYEESKLEVYKRREKYKPKFRDRRFRRSVDD